MMSNSALSRLVLPVLWLSVLVASEPSDADLSARIKDAKRVLFDQVPSMPYGAPATNATISPERAARIEAAAATLEALAPVQHLAAMTASDGSPAINGSWRLTYSTAGEITRLTRLPAGFVLGLTPSFVLCSNRMRLHLTLHAPTPLALAVPALSCPPHPRSPLFVPPLSLRCSAKTSSAEPSARAPQGQSTSPSTSRASASRTKRPSCTRGTSRPPLQGSWPTLPLLRSEASTLSA